MKLITLILVVLIVSCKPQNNVGEIQESGTIFLVRHAEKADDGTKDPPLTTEGENRADKLVELLIEKDIKAVYSTDFKRTRNTGFPLADTLGLFVNLYDPSSESFAEEIMKEASDANLLVVGHSNTTPILVNKILGKEKYRQLDDSDYGKLFVCEKDGDAFDCRVVEF